MKKIISILSLACLSLAGCETIVTLDNGVDARLDAVMKGYIATLAGAENGWMASVETSEGYYRYHMSFTDNNKVTMYTDNTYYPELNGVAKTSTYNVRALQRPVIAFDTYTYIHIPNDPNDSISGGEDNMGLGTDFEFEVDSLGQDGVFYLTGRVNRIHATFRPATAEEVAKVKEGALLEVLDHAAASSGDEFYGFMVGDKKVDVFFASRGITAVYRDAQGSVRIANGNTVTELNYDLDLPEPLVIEDKKLEGFKWDEATGMFEAMIDGAPVKMEKSEDTAVSLIEILQGDTDYSTMISVGAMYEEGVANPIATAWNRDSQLMERQWGIGLQQAQITFPTSDRMLLRVIFGGGFPGEFTFTVAWDENDSTQFKVTKLSFDPTSVVGSNGEYIYQLGMGNLGSYFVGKTFQLVWSKLSFGTYLMGQIEEVTTATPGIFYGALQ